LAAIAERLYDPDALRRRSDLGLNSVLDNLTGTVKQ
jgi:hypothetical protein